MEINHLPDKEFKVMVMKVITDLDRRINRKLQQRDGKKKKKNQILRIQQLKVTIQ